MKPTFNLSRHLSCDLHQTERVDLLLKVTHEPGSNTEVAKVRAELDEAG